MTAPEATALASATWAVLALSLSAVNAWRGRTAKAVAPPAGPAWPGIVYAFGAGMSPGAKESARQHPFVYAAGVTYHGAIFAAILTFAVALTGGAVPTWIGITLGVLPIAGVAAGVVLAARRLASPLLREISAPDDYASNMLVDAWLASAAIFWLVPGAAWTFLIVSTLLFVYAPLGKIRHCAFFFIARALFGARLGRRGLVRSPGTAVRT